MIRREGPLSEIAGWGDIPPCRTAQSRVLRIVPTFIRHPQFVVYRMFGCDLFSCVSALRRDATPPTGNR